MRIYLYVLHTVTLSCIHTHSLYCLIISYCDIYNQNNKYKVPSAGNDGVSSLIWSSKANHLVSTNWDGGVRCWEIQESGQQVRALPKAQGELVVSYYVYYIWLYIFDYDVSQQLENILSNYITIYHNNKQLTMKITRLY